MELKAESRAKSGFPQGTLLPIIRSPGPDEALCSTVLLLKFFLCYQLKILSLYYWFEYL
jgi:hypothetical protein